MVAAFDDDEADAVSSFALALPDEADADVDDSLRLEEPLPPLLLLLAIIEHPLLLLRSEEQSSPDDDDDQRVLLIKEVYLHAVVNEDFLELHNNDMDVMVNECSKRWSSSSKLTDERRRIINSRTEYLDVIAFLALPQLKAVKCLYR